MTRGLTAADRQARGTSTAARQARGLSAAAGPEGICNVTF
jgi:hypothetical protein